MAKDPKSSISAFALTLAITLALLLIPSLTSCQEIPGSSKSEALSALDSEEREFLALVNEHRGSIERP